MNASNPVSGRQPGDAFWCEPQPAGGVVRIGCIEAWMEGLGGDPVGLELLPAGTQVIAGDSFGMLHLPERSVDLRSPWTLKITTVNREALNDARLVKLSPSYRGWLIEAVLG